jgi:hypothetical protein
MTSSDMPGTPAGRRAAQPDGPRSAQPKRRTFTAAYKPAVIEKYDAAAEPGAKGADHRTGQSAASVPRKQLRNPQNPVAQLT